MVVQYEINSASEIQNDIVCDLDIVDKIYFFKPKQPHLLLNLWTWDLIVLLTTKSGKFASYYTINPYIRDATFQEPPWNQEISDRKKELSGKMKQCV